MNANPKHEPKNERDCCETFASQQNITAHQDMSHETYVHAWQPNNLKVILLM